MISLQSGSNGNCVYVESGDVRLLFDAGISGIQAQERLVAHGLDTSGLDGLFISHDHSDHVRGVGVFMRKFKVPLYVTPRTLAVSRRRMQLGAIEDVRHFKAGDVVKIRHVSVETIATPHDAVDGVVFVVDDGRSRLGICTDLGHVYSELASLVNGVDALFLESNYDERMLEAGDYPRALKRRISGPGGHISNRDAAELLERHASGRLQWVCLAHLSAENNRPDIALKAHRAILGESLPIHIAPRYVQSPIHVVGGAPGALDARPPPVTPRKPSTADLIFAPLKGARY